MTNDALNEKFKQEMLQYRQWKRDEVLDALIALETAAWSRRWTDVKAARARIEELTGLTIIGPLRRELERRRRELAAPGDLSD